jgi:hypothetical protein
MQFFFCARSALASAGAEASEAIATPRINTDFMTSFR